MEDMNDLSLNNIVSSNDVETLFMDNNVDLTEVKAEPSDDTTEKKKNNETIEVRSDNLFDDSDESESVDGEDNNQGDENPTFNETGDSSATFYSSIASALKNDGVLENLDEEQIGAIMDADSFKAAIEQEISLRLNESDRRIKEALDYGIEPTEISKYQNTLQYLNGLNEEILSAETEEAELERKRLIFQDCINHGMSEQRALREVEKSLNAGTDIEDAIEALTTNKEFYQKSYDSLINAAKEEEANRRKQIEEKEEELRNLVIDTEEPFDGISIDKATRNKILENIAKPTIKDKDGNYYTKLQDYQLRHPNEFLHKLGVIFTLTDGFKDIDKFVGKKVRQETNKNIRGLERTLKNQRNYGSNPRYIGNGKDDDSSRQNFSRFSLNI